MNLRVFYYTNRHGYNHIKDITVTKNANAYKNGKHCNSICQLCKTEIIWDGVAVKDWLY